MKKAGKPARKKSGASCSAPAAPDSAEAPNRTRRRRFRAAAAGLALIVCWGIPELVVRAIDPPLQAYTTIYFGGDPNSPRLFQSDPVLHWKLRPDTRVEFLGHTVQTDRDGFRNPPAVRGAARTAVCLGDSTTFGWGVTPEASFPSLLEKQLPGGPWRVINAGVPGYTSFQARQQVAQWLPSWQPDLVVICVGNNEAWPVRRSDRRLHERGRGRIALQRFLSRSRFLVWAAERFRSETPQPFIARNLEGTEPRVGPGEFEDNLQHIIEPALSHGARVILLGPPANLYKPPLRVDKFIAMEPFTKYVDELFDMLEEERFDEALRMVDASLAAEPDRFWYLWCRGMVLHSMGQSETAREVFREAFERHPYPERCKPSYRAILRRLAEQHRVEYLDVNDLFHRLAAPDPPVELYQDWCHPTAEGHRHIANAIAEM